MNEPAFDPALLEDTALPAAQGAAPAAEDYKYTDPSGQVWAWNPFARVWAPWVDDKLLEEQQKAYGYPTDAASLPKNKAAAKPREPKEKRPHSDEAPLRAKSERGAEANGNDDEDNDEDNDEDESESKEAASGGSTAEVEARARRLAKKKARRALKEAEEASVYVTGLPEDADVDALVLHMSKCGLVKRDANSGEWKCKLYRLADGRAKGDATVTYFKKESVPLALQMLDDSEFRPGCRIRVTRATFDKKPLLLSRPGESAAASNARKVKSKRRRMNQLQQLGWTDDEKRKHVVLHNAFSPDDARAETGGLPEAMASYFRELRDDIAAECAAKFGEVESVKVFELHPGGIVALKFRQSAAAQQALDALNGRFFGGRQLKAEWYDGVTNFQNQAAALHNQKLRQQQQQQQQQQQAQQDAAQPPAPANDEATRADSWSKWLEEGSSSEEETPAAKKPKE